jgi:hypothetical protein
VRVSVVNRLETDVPSWGTLYDKIRRLLFALKRHSTSLQEIAQSVRLCRVCDTVWRDVWRIHTCPVAERASAAAYDMEAGSGQIKWNAGFSVERASLSPAAFVDQASFSSFVR